MRTPKVVLFDLDGTLIDSIELIIDSYRHTFTTHGLPSLSREEIVLGIGTPLRTVFGAMTDDSETMAKWIDTYRDYNLTHHDNRVTAFPGAVDMVERIAATGVRMGLVTSKNNAGARRGLALIGLADVMEVVIGADDVEHPKPHPEPVLKALEAMNCAPGEAVFIGDSHHDLECGRAAGVKTIAVTWGPFSTEHLMACGPDHCCNTTSEVLAALGITVD
jgi:pyrophosphatase PpaX